VADKRQEESSYFYNIQCIIVVSKEFDKTYQLSDNVINTNRGLVVVKKYLFIIFSTLLLVLSACGTSGDDETSVEEDSKEEVEDIEEKEKQEEVNKEQHEKEEESDGDQPVSEGDIEACDIYDSTVDSAENVVITEEEEFDNLEEAFYLAESNELVDLIDDLLIYFEEDEDYGIDLQDTTNNIRSFCALD